MRAAAAFPRGAWPRRELRALAMRFSLLDDAAFCLVRAGMLTALQGKAMHAKIARTREREFKKILRASRAAHKLNKPITD